MHTVWENASRKRTNGMHPVWENSGATARKRDACRITYQSGSIIPQTVFSCRGSGGVGKDAGGPVPPPREF